MKQKQIIKKILSIVLAFTIILCSVKIEGIKIVNASTAKYQLCWPVSKNAKAIGKVSSKFGPRTKPTAGASSNHRGVDIAVKTGTNVYVAADGIVTKVGYSSVRGNYVVVYHKDIDLSTLYQHLKKYVVKKNQIVRSGQVIAQSGNTGIGTGAHLHYGVIKGKATNPNYDQIGYNKAINPLSLDINYHYYNQEVTYNIKQANTTGVTRDSVTFNLKMNQKAPIERVGVFFGTSEKEIKSITDRTAHSGKKGKYTYNLLNYNAKKTSTDTYSFSTKKKTQNGYKITLSAGTTYYYKMVVLIGDRWYISDITKFTTLNNPPSAVTGLAVKENKIGRNGKATISWKQSSGAESYSITVKDSSGKAVYSPATNKGTTNISYTTKELSKPGQYTATVTACNSSGNSSGQTVAFTVMEDLSFIFSSEIDGINSEIKAVKYNATVKTPAAPKREGYTFDGWKNADTGRTIAALTDINNVKASGTYEAVWTANKYTVKIVDGIDNTVLQEQKEPYDSVVKMSEYYSQDVPVHKNYKFIGWSEDEYKINSTSTHTIYARYEWDSDNQVVTKINSVKRASSTGKSTDGTDGYSIDVAVTAPALVNGSKNPIIRGRVVAVLKTKAGRMLIETESSAFVLYTQDKKATSKDINIFVPYEATTSEALASVVEIYVVNNYKSAGVISEVETDMEKIADANADEWKYTTDKTVLNRSDVIKGADKDNFVTYDLTTTIIKESLNTSMSGYSLVSSRWSGVVDSGYQKFVKSWPAIGNSMGSKYNNSKGAGKDRYDTYYKPESQWIKATEDSTQKIEIKDTPCDYIYYHWCCNRNNGNLVHNVTGSKYYSEASGNKYYTFHCHSLSPENTLTQYYCSLSNLKKDVYEYDTSGSSKFYRDQCTDSKYWIGRITAYQRDWTLKRKIYTYSNSTVQTSLKADTVSGVPQDSSTGLKETGSYYSDKLKTYQKTDTNVSNITQWYAYKTKIEVAHEDKNKVADIETGRVKCDSVSKYAGKNVTLYIYKNGEMSDSNTEYMGIKTFDKSGNLDISDIQLREECSEITGDFTIAVALADETNAMVIGKIEAPKKQYTVTFDAEKKTGTDGTIEKSIIDKQIVEEGGNAVLPDESLIPEKEGYHFVGWSQSTAGVHDDLTVTALYEKNEYAVVYVDWENRSVEIKKTEYEGDIEMLEIPETEDGITATWVIGDGSDENAQTLDEYVEEGNKVTSDMVVSVKYEYETYVVNVLTSENPDEIEEEVEKEADTEDLIDDYSVKTETLAYGDLMQLDEYEEELSENKDVIFYGWKNAATGEYIAGNEITSDVTIYPVYEYAETTEIPTADITTGEYSSKQTVTLKSETEDAVIYYTTDGTEPKNSVTAKEYTGPVILSKSCVLKAYAGSMGRNDSESIVELYAINTGTSGTPYHIVTIYSDIAEQEGDCYQTLIKDATLIDISELKNVEGYKFSGLYYDENNTDEFDEDSELVTETLDLFIHYTPNIYTVKFFDESDNLISEQKIEYGGSAQEPTPNKKEGYIFVGWDNDEYELVTENINCKAIYVPENQYATVSLNKSNVTTMEGMQYSKLVARISPEELSDTEVTWTSSDPSIATVDGEGVVYAQSAGIATISVMVNSTGESASCTFKVVGNYQTSIVLNEKSKLGIDSEGYLREIKPDRNTVEEVLSEFNNEPGNLKAYDRYGKELTGEDLVGTGTVIKFISEGEEFDSMTVIMTGDVNGDGHLGNIDVSKLSKWLIQTEELTYEQQLACDVNGDGSVDNKDASMISRCLVGKESL